MCPRFRSRTCSVLATFVLAVAAENQLYAQTNSNLLAPSYQSRLQTACIEVDDGKFKLIRSNTEIQARDIGDANDEENGTVEIMQVEEMEIEVNDDGTGVMQQSYTVMVPYTEMIEVDGKQVPVTRTRTETRTRSMPVKNAENSKIVQYEIGIPVSVAVQNLQGEVYQVMQIQNQTRTRLIGKDQELVRRKVATVSHLKEGSFKFYKLDGTTVSPDEAANIIVERSPVIILMKDDPDLDEYYESLLNPETPLVFVKPKSPEDSANDQ